MPFAEIADVALHYDLTGPPGAPVVVLSNALGTNFRMWDAQVQEFSRQLRVLRYDTRGHGNSSTPKGPYSLSTLANDVVHLLDHLEISKASVCGVSLGGMTALWLAIHAKDRVQCIVAANTASRIGSMASWNQRIQQVQKYGMSSLTEGALERWYTPAFRATQHQVLTTSTCMLERSSKEGYAACCAAIRDMDLTDEIHTICVPTLIVAGGHDSVTPPADARFLESKIPDALYIELNAAHLSNIEASGVFNAASLPFLLTQEQPHE